MPTPSVSSRSVPVVPVAMRSWLDEQPTVVDRPLREVVLLVVVRHEPDDLARAERRVRRWLDLGACHTTRPPVRVRLGDQRRKHRSGVSTDDGGSDRSRLGAGSCSVYSLPMQQMYHPDDLASMDPLVLMKNLDHVRMTSRRLSYILQQQVHLYVPEANELRVEIDRYVEAERQIEAELARRQIRA